MSSAPCILYCHCAYAQVVPEATKQAVLAGLAASGQRFEAVADLCEMSARRDPALARLAAQPGLRIAACYHRAVKWLFHGAGQQLPEDAAVLNMREATAEGVLEALFASTTTAIAAASQAKP